MEPPMCKICQTKHWSRDGHGGALAPKAGRPARDGHDDHTFKPTKKPKRKVGR